MKYSDQALRFSLNASPLLIFSLISRPRVGAAKAKGLVLSNCAEKPVVHGGDGQCPDCLLLAAGTMPWQFDCNIHKKSPPQYKGGLSYIKPYPLDQSGIGAVMTTKTTYLIASWPIFGTEFISIDGFCHFNRTQRCTGTGRAVTVRTARRSCGAIFVSVLM